MAAPDILAASVAFLRANSLTSVAFGDSASTSKFWTDYAGLNAQTFQPDYPYLVFQEPQESETYESQSETDDGSSLSDGIVDFDVMAPSKTTCRQLSILVAKVLNDAPLIFNDGGLVYFRHMSKTFPKMTEIGIDGQATVFKRTVRFRFLIEHDPF
jgi:hypothetical protein